MARGGKSLHGCSASGVVVCDDSSHTFTPRGYHDKAATSSGSSNKKGSVEDHVLRYYKHRRESWSKIHIYLAFILMMAFLSQICDWLDSIAFPPPPITEVGTNLKT